MAIVHIKRKYAFTITELSVSLLLLVVVSAVFFAQAITVTKKKSDVEKVQTTYTLLEKAAIAWQNENGCDADIKMCISMEKAKGVPDNEIFNGIAKYLPVINASVNINAKGRNVYSENIRDVDWLPANTKTFSGKLQSSSSLGVSKYKDADSDKMAYYRLRDGVTIAVNMSEYGSNTGFGFFDINGKAGENRIGYDVFPFSLGANIGKKDALYDDAGTRFNPYFSSNNYDGLDLCNINLNVCINEKLKTNPTYYVLKWKKLPY